MYAIPFENHNYIESVQVHTNGNYVLMTNIIGFTLLSQLFIYTKISLKHSDFNCLVQTT
jgi:hypothetical protein